MSQPQALTLETVQLHFKKWRANKLGSTRVPESLWHLVKQLLESSHYKRSKVAGELGISTHQLRKRFPNFYPQLSSKKISTNKITHVMPGTKSFVQAPLNKLAIMTSSTLTIERSDGFKLSLSEPSKEQLSALVKTFME